MGAVKEMKNCFVTQVWGSLRGDRRAGLEVLAHPGMLVTDKSVLDSSVFRKFRCKLLFETLIPKTLKKKFPPPSHL